MDNLLEIKEKLINIFYKYKFYIISIIIIITIIIIFTLFKEDSKIEKYIELIGPNTINIYVGDDYTELGYKAYDNKNNSYKDEVIIDSNLNTKIPGEYTISYKLGEKEVKRKIIVLDIKLNLKLTTTEYTSSNVDVIINVESTYFDYLKLPDGTKVYSKNYTYTVDKNGTYKFVTYNKDGRYIKKSIEIKNIDKEKPTGTCTASFQNGKTTINIDALDNVGIEKYVIEEKKYTINEIILSKELKNINILVYDKTGNSNTIKCDAINKNNSITLTKNTNDYTKNNININVSIKSDYFDYLKLPNGNKVYNKNYTYIVDKNGTYKFMSYDKDGNYVEKSIVVNNIDKTKPTGSCSGTYKDGISKISINSSDNIGIKNYVINNVSYTTKNIVLNKEVSYVNISIYDLAGNTRTISCNLIDKNEFITSDSSITFNYEYFPNNNNTLAYGLFTPSSAKNNRKTPLIIWLHGSGEKGVSKDTFKISGLLKVLSDWSLEGFNAYVLCPHLAGNYRSYNWDNETLRERINELLNKIKNEKNIDTTKIILVGHSLGAKGVQYLAAKDNYYSALVVLSGYNPNSVDINTINIPTVGYVGTTASGEDSSSYKYMTGTFKNVFGSSNLHVLNTSHGKVPKVSFTTDKNNDNKSDLIEWMLKQ